MLWVLTNVYSLVISTTVMIIEYFHQSKRLRHIPLQSFPPPTFWFLACYFSFSRISYKGSHTVCSFYVWFLSFSVIFRESFMLLLVSKVCSYSLLSSTQLYGNATICFSVHQMTDIWIVSRFGPLWIKLLWVFTYSSLCRAALPEGTDFIWNREWRNPCLLKTIEILVEHN